MRLSTLAGIKVMFLDGVDSIDKMVLRQGSPIIVLGNRQFRYLPKNKPYHLRDVRADIYKIKRENVGRR